MKIKDIPKENRPRERMLKLGPTALSTAELLAIILQKGTKEENVIDMSNRLISKHGLEKLSELSLKELQEIKGIGPAKSMQILALFEFNSRIKMHIGSSKKMKKPLQAYEYAVNKIGKLKKEVFLALFLNSRHTLIRDEIITIGLLDKSLIHPRELFRKAMNENANYIIIAHNHPSQDPTPSLEDRKTTEILFESGKILGISVLDHLIVTNNSYYSFKENLISSVQKDDANSAESKVACSKTSSVARSCLSGG